ncbi:hypothetical protein BKA83DRAFT_4131869 [Pisolithus microcarpus]|nr:hypothetical protein BKA83DRAFT_4131869 [Pisolithus microcarpus]
MHHNRTALPIWVILRLSLVVLVRAVSTVRKTVLHVDSHRRLIFHLAPQDYHWFHVPVDGMIRKMMDILGSIILLMPQAIWSMLGVYVGLTIVMLLEKGMVEWDEDLLIDGCASLERLAHVGMGIVGRCRNRFVKGNYIRP